MFDLGFSRRAEQENSSSVKITQTGRPGYALTIHTHTQGQRSSLGQRTMTEAGRRGGTNTPTSMNAITNTNTGYDYLISSRWVISSLSSPVGNNIRQAQSVESYNRRPALKHSKPEQQQTGLKSQNSLIETQENNQMNCEQGSSMLTVISRLPGFHHTSTYYSSFAK